MPNLSSVAGFAAGVLAVASCVPYMLSMIRGTATPNRATWWIWTMVGFITLASYNAGGARETLWVPAVCALGNLANALLALRYGEGGLTRFDLLCLGSAGLSLVLWKIFDSPMVGLVASLGTHFIGLLPTLKKIATRPESESKLAWSLGVAANGLNILAINHWNFTIGAQPVYTFLVCAMVIALLYRRGAKRITASFPQTTP